MPRAEHGRSALPRAPCLSGAAPAPSLPLTAVVVQRGELCGLVAAASAVAGLHAELVPRGLAQLCQEDLTGAVGAEALPDPVALGPVLQDNGGDGAAPTAPALQVQPGMRGVDVGEEVLVLAEGGLCGRGAVRRAAAERGPLRRGDHSGARTLRGRLTSAVGLGFDDLADAASPHAVLGCQLHLVPGATLEALQLEGALGGADEHVLPLLAVVHRVLEHEACGCKDGAVASGRTGGRGRRVAPGQGERRGYCWHPEPAGYPAPASGTSCGHVRCSARAAITHRFLPNGDRNAALYSCAADVGYGYLKTASRDELLPCWTLRAAQTEAGSPAGTACSADPGRSHRREARGHPQQLATSRVLCQSPRPLPPSAPLSVHRLPPVPPPQPPSLSFAREHGECET